MKYLKSVKHLIFQRILKYVCCNIWKTQFLLLIPCGLLNKSRNIASFLLLSLAILLQDEINIKFLGAGNILPRVFRSFTFAFLPGISIQQFRTMLLTEKQPPPAADGNQYTIPLKGN